MLSPIEWVEALNTYLLKTYVWSVTLYGYKAWIIGKGAVFAERGRKRPPP